MKITDIYKDKIYNIKTELIYESPYQPRKSIDNEKLKGLIQSVRKNGIIQPICVRKISKNRYELIYGHRRLMAAKSLDIKTVPCVIKDISNQNSYIFALIENIQRENLNFIEEAKAIDGLIKKHKLTQSEIASHLGISQPSVANKLRLLKLSERQVERINNFSLSQRHARALLRIEDEDLRDDILNEIIVKNLNVEETEKMIDNLFKPHESKDKNKFVVKDVRLFVNSINKAIKVMKGSGINAKSVKEEDENFIKYTVTIPKK